MKAGPAAIFALLAIAAAAACGGNGGGGALSKEEYGAELNAVCGAFNEKRDAVIDEVQSLEAFAAKGPQIVAGVDVWLAEMRAREAPEEVAGQAKRLISLVERQRRWWQQQVVAARDGDAQGWLELAAAEPGAAELDEIAARLGAPTCGENYLGF